MGIILIYIVKQKDFKNFEEKDCVVLIQREKESILAQLLRRTV